MKTFSIIVAADEARGVGREDGLPWRLPGEMAYFKRVTSEAQTGLQNAVIMGRKTYLSIPEKFRPLAGRKNIVLTRGHVEVPSEVALVGSLDAALMLASDDRDLDQVFVIGGGSVYREALEHPACARVLLTRVHATFACDTFLPPLSAAFHRIRSDGPHHDGDVGYTFEVYERNDTGA